MSKNNLFINDEKILIQYDSQGMSRSSDFIFTDLKKIQQVTINKNECDKVISFMIKNMGAYGDDKITREQIKEIANECKIREIIYTKNELVSICGKLELRIADKEKDEYYSIVYNDEIYTQIQSLYKSMEFQMCDTILSDNNLELLKKRGIDMYNVGCLIITGFSGSSAETLEITGYSPHDIKYKNTGWERERYLKAIKDSQNK